MVGPLPQSAEGEERESDDGEGVMVAIVVLVLAVALSWVALWPIVLRATLRLLLCLIAIPRDVGVEVAKASVVWPRAIRISNVRIKPSLLVLVDAFVDVRALSVKTIEVVLPSPKSLLFGVHVDGTKVDLVQRRYPKPRERKRDARDWTEPFTSSLARDAVLEIVERILWTDAGAADVASSNDSATDEAVEDQEKKSRPALVGSVLQRVFIRVTATEVTYSQESRATRIVVSVGDIYFQGARCLLHYKDGRKLLALLGRKYKNTKYTDKPTCITGVSSVKVGIINPSKGAESEIEDITKWKATYLIQQWSLRVALWFENGPRGTTLDVDADVNSLAIALDEACLNHLLPLLSTLQHYFAHECVWRHRPQKPVINHSKEWWQHAVDSVKEESKQHRSPYVSLRDLGKRRNKRSRYLSIYKAKHSRWWQVWLYNNGKRVDKLLKEAEKGLAFEEVAHFRSQYAFMRARPKDRSECLERLGKVDAIVNNISMAEIYKTKDQSPTFHLTLSLTCPKVDLSLSQASYWDSYKKTTSLGLQSLKMSVVGTNVTLSCSGLSVHSDKIQGPLVKAAGEEGLLNLTTEKDADDLPYYLVRISTLDVTICPDWMEQLMDVANLASCCSQYFLDASSNLTSLVQDTYNSRPSRPPPVTLGAPLVLQMERFALSLTDVDPHISAPSNKVTLSLENTVVEKSSSLQNTATLRSRSLHRRRRKHFETVIPCVKTSLKVRTNLCIFIQKPLDSNLSKIQKMLDLQSLAIGMNTEDSVLPKSLASSVMRCSVTAPILNVFVSESRLVAVSQLLDEMLLRVSMKKESQIVPPKGIESVLSREKISAEGQSDAFADFYVNLDTIALNFLTDESRKDATPVLAVGICNVMFRYHKDSKKDLQVVKFGVGAIMTETYVSSYTHCIVGPKHAASRVDLKKRFSSKRKWARLRQHLQSEMIFDYFPNWMVYQIQGTVYISKNTTTALMVHLANIDFLVDTDLYKPILKYIFSLQDSFVLHSGGTAEKERAEPAQAEAPVATESISLVEINATSLSVTLSHSLKDKISSIQCLNTTASLYKSTGHGEEDAQNNTKLNIERISVVDLISKGKDEILGIEPMCQSKGNGIRLSHDVKESESATLIEISQIHLRFIQRFIQDLLYFVSCVTSALPSKKETGEAPTEPEEDQAEESEPKSSGSLSLSVKNVAIVLPIHKDNDDKFFKLVVSVKVRVGAGIQCAVGGLQGQPHLEICLNNLSLGFQHTFLGFHDFIPETSLLCYVESIDKGQTRMVLFCNILSLNLSQLIYGHLMELLSGNMADASVFTKIEEEEIVLKTKDDFSDSVYKYQELLGFPKEDSPGLEVCISSSQWKIKFEDADSPVQYGVMTFDSPSFAYRIMSTGNNHMCISCSSFSLRDTHTIHTLKEILKGTSSDETSDPSFQFILLLQKEGPMVIELKLSNTLINWPYLKDMSFISNILSVLKTNEYDDQKPVKLVSPSFSKWFYFNLIAKETRIFLPLPVVQDEIKEEANGVMLKTDTLQFKYACGSDGETAIRVRGYDVEVGFKLKRSILPNTSFLLPFNLQVEMNMNVPVFDENVAKTRKVLVARKLQRWWRENHGKKYKDETLRKPPESGLERVKSYSQLTKRKAFILEHGFSPNERETSLTRLNVTIDKIVLKACFSEVFMWNRILKSLSSEPERPDADESGSEGLPEPLTEIVFRPSMMEVDLKLNSISVVICDDRPRTYGNPDVLRLFAKTFDLQYKVDCQEEDTGAKTSADLKLTLSAEYLDSSVSRYASIVLPWELQIEFHQQEDAYSGKSNSLWLNSEERLNIQVSPHILLALGDAMTFSKMLTAETSKEYVQNMRKDSVVVQEGDLDLDFERGEAPQKYCLNNYSGINFWYFCPGTSAHRVSDGKRVIVREKPYLAEKEHWKHKKSTTMTGSSTIQFECLNLQFEGNWSPLLQVNVSLVGKYKVCIRLSLVSLLVCLLTWFFLFLLFFQYMLEAPLHNVEVPVIVDIVLVGRTKVISVHSPYWIFNRSDRDLVFRLKQSLGYLNAPSSDGNAGTSASDMEAMDLSSDVVIGPIEPDSGFYLPITSSIMHKSILFVKSADGLLESTAHSIHINGVDKMSSQQQMIECNSEAQLLECTPTPQLAAPGQSVASTSQTVGEVSAPGTDIPISDLTITESEESPGRQGSSEMEEISFGSERDLQDEPGTSRGGGHSPISVLSESIAGADRLSSFFCNLQIIEVPPQQVHLPSWNMDSHGLSSSIVPIECELSFQPPLTVNNALPYDIEINIVDMKGGVQSLTNAEIDQPTLERTASIGSTGSRTSISFSATNSATKRRLTPNLTSSGVLLKPGSKADIYCDLQVKQKMTIKVVTAAQGILKTHNPVVIHDGNLINDKGRQASLPKHAMLHPFTRSSIAPNASEVAEIELTSASMMDHGETPLSPGQEGSGTVNVSNKHKVKIGIDNEPTGMIGRKITIYCPYWIDNQTNMDLLFSENNSLPLFGRSRRKDEVLVPGNIITNDSRSPLDAPAKPLPVLINTDVQRIFFRIAGESLSPYGPSVNIKRPGPSGHNPIPISGSALGGQRQSENEKCRLFHFAVDLLPCPSDSIYNKTKVISVKTAIIVENMSTFSIIYKQTGVNDASDHCKVESGQSVEHKWESIFNPLEITIRPSGSIWSWSSSFPLLVSGDTYFGLRLCHQDQEDVFLIIPVSITVSSTHILVSFKDPSAEPPYRIQNDCKEICVRFKQVADDKKLFEGPSNVGAPLAGARLLMSNLSVDEVVQMQDKESLADSNPETTVMPGTSINYAWDVPMWPHRLSVDLMRENDMEIARVEYSIDELGDRKPITLSEAKRNTSRAFIPTPSFSKKKREKNAASHLEKKLKAVLAKELASKVFVSVYADGPTRVLKISDKKDSASIQSELSMLEMHARLRKLEDELANNVNRKFANLMGHMKSRPMKIDLYGRNQKYLDSYLKMSSSVIDHWQKQPQKTPGRRKLEAKQQHQARLLSKSKAYMSKRITQDILVNELDESLGDNSAAILSLGGDLTVTVHSAKSLAGNPNTTHTYAEVEIDGQSYQTNISLQTCDPIWDESFTFLNVRATSFLDLNIFRVRAQTCAPVRKSGASKTFWGSHRISLLESFTMESSDSIHYTLGREKGTDKVSGEVVISLSWRTNANSLMHLKVQTLEDILAQRMEILAQLKPLSAEEWEERVSNIKRRENLVHHLGYQTGELQVSVMGAKNLQKRSSFQPLATLDFSIEGPFVNPFVVVKCSKSKEDKEFSTNVVHQSLEPLFDKSKKFKFEEVPLSASLTFELYDKNPFGRPELLATRTIYCSEISTSISTPFNPVYAWIRLNTPLRHTVDVSPEINVRMQWNPPHSTVRNVTSINVTLSSIGLAMISGVLGGELINTTLDNIKLNKVQVRFSLLFKRVNTETNSHSFAFAFFLTHRMTRRRPSLDPSTRFKSTISCQTASSR